MFSSILVKTMATETIVDSTPLKNIETNISMFTNYWLISMTALYSLPSFNVGFQIFFATFLGENFDCTKFHCSWKNYVKGQDWDYYSETNGNCSDCKQRCNDDSNCGAIECGNDYCSWWKKGECKEGDITNNTLLFTCRLTPEGILR